MNDRASGPFGARGGAVLAFVGIALFLFTLWAAGHEMDRPPAAPQTVRSQGRGFDGYAALGQYLTRRGVAVVTLDSEATAAKPGLLVLTPPHRTDLAQLDRMVIRHRAVGPVVLILPKWKPTGLIQKVSKGPQKGGRVEQLVAGAPHWPGWHDELAVDLYPLPSRTSTGRWTGLGTQGTLPEIDGVQSGQGRGLVGLVTDTETGRVLAGYLEDGGDYPALRSAAGYDAGPSGLPPPAERFPLVVVFEPDLLNNYGFAQQQGARLTDSLVRTLLGAAPRQVILDQMTSVTLGEAPREGPSLIKLAFTPPFLAATVCLVLAALVLFWRALHRFGPARLATRSIAFGKRALVANAAGLIQRARRLHLLGAPYADAARDRLARELAVPARLDNAATEQAIDRAGALRAPGSEPFSRVAARLRAARRPADLVAAARHLHALERTLMR